MSGWQGFEKPWVESMTIIDRPLFQLRALVKTLRDGDEF